MRRRGDKGQYRDAEQERHERNRRPLRGDRSLLVAKFFRQIFGVFVSVKRRVDFKGFYDGLLLALIDAGCFFDVDDFDLLFVSDELRGSPFLRQSKEKQQEIDCKNDAQRSHRFFIGFDFFRLRLLDRFRHSVVPFHNYERERRDIIDVRADSENVRLFIFRRSSSDVRLPDALFQE